MPKSNTDQLLSRGLWLLIVGIFTSWLLGLGLLFILAAAICAFISLCRGRVLRGSLLLVSCLLLGFFFAHLAAVIDIYAYNRLAGRPTRLIIPGVTPN
jgi:hypothetical protein